MAERHWQRTQKRNQELKMKFTQIFMIFDTLKICFYKIDQMWTDKTYIAVLKRQASLQFAVLITILDDVVS